MYQVKFIEDATKIVFKEDVRCLSWAPHNGAVQTNIRAVVNRTLTEYVKESELETFIKKNTACPDKTVVLLTAVPQRYLQIAEERHKKTGLKITVFCTAGIGNARAAGDKALYSKELCQAGTINIIVIVNKALSLKAQIELSSVVTMAKCQAMHDRKIISPISGNLCIGTGTDCIAICSPNPAGGSVELQYAGLHTKLAELTAKAVMAALARALERQLAFLRLFLDNPFLP